MGSLSRAAIVLALASLPIAAFAASGSNAQAFPGSNGENGASGYWFYAHRPKAETYVPVPAPAPPKQLKPDTCAHPATWTPSCGFVIPHSFSFQSKERDALMHSMVMHPGNMRTVKAMQRYTRWVVDQAVEASRVWQYNTVQDPALNAAAHSPISAYGLQLAFSTHALNEAGAWKAIKRFHGVLILFTKSTCDYCAAEVPPMQGFERDTGLEIWQASLKGPCDPAFAKRCVPPAETRLPAQMLHVSVVPTLFLYLPKNVWIRVFAGLTTTQTTEDNLYNFFVAWREASVKQLKATGAGPAMDFDPRDRPNPERMRQFLQAQLPRTAVSGQSQQQ